MNEISKLAAKIQNSEKYNTAEIRITVDDARALLAEIELLRIPVMQVVPESKTLTHTHMDGGKFGS